MAAEEDLDLGEAAVADGGEFDVAVAFAGPEVYSYITQTSSPEAGTSSTIT